MQLLRDLREATTMLVLYSVTTERHTHLRSLADELGMTVQGASEYVRRMIEQGLLQRVDGEYRATKKGVELLLGRFLELRSFVDRASRAMAFIVTTSALAGSPIRRGERVGLFMEEGMLVATATASRPRRGSRTKTRRKGKTSPFGTWKGSSPFDPVESSSPECHRRTKGERKASGSPPRRRFVQLRRMR